MSCDLTVEEARAALDERVRESMKWHFSPETGCPYWLERAKELDFDPIAEVTCFAEIQKFPKFDDDVLRRQALQCV
jgi:hypothetical protein